MPTTNPTTEKKTGLVWDERYLLHDTGLFHPERPERLNAIKQILKDDRSYEWITPRIASIDEIAWVHTKDHIDEVLKCDGISQHFFDGDTPAGPHSTEAAFLAAGGLMKAVQEVEEGKIKNAFVFPRPPGHHAESDHAMGFCIFNNVAIAAQYLIKQKNKKRIVIMDFDVHHGNGTQHFFYERSDVFYLSTHRFPFYPGTGSGDETGVGEGMGTTLNVPLDAYADDEDYRASFENQIIPAIDHYKPDFILVSAGYDAHIRDPLGGMKVTKEGFFMMSQSLSELAKKHCGGKIVYVLEGGYDLKGLQEGVSATLESL
ncbi:MAG: histone deacetylase family protein [uncultured bacterium]|nr:MAG: histone deacetylase family protein [uncultured bacterium]